MNSLLAVFASAVFYTAAGWTLTYMLGKITYLERVGAAFLVGNGLTTFIWFILYVFGIRFDLNSWVLAGMIVGLIGITVNTVFKLRYAKLPSPKFSGMNRWLLLSVLILILLAFLIGSYNPISGWDAIALYDFRGHTIALNHSLKDLTESSYYLSYPLLVSLDHAAIYLLGGINAQGFHSLLLMALVLVVLGRMSQWTNLRFGLLSSLAIILNEEIYAHAATSYSNLAYTAYFVTGLLYLSSPAKKSDQIGGYLVVGGLLSGLTTWIRSDVPFWLIPMVLIIIQGVSHRKYLLAFLSLISAYLFRWIWLGYYHVVVAGISPGTDKLSNPYTANSINPLAGDISKFAGILEKLPAIIEHLNANIYSPYRGLWLLLIVGIVVSITTKNKRLALLSLPMLITAIIVIIGVMIFSVTTPSWNLLGGSSRRMILFIIPMGIVIGYYSLYHLINKKEEI